MGRPKRGYETLIINGRVEMNKALAFREHLRVNKISLQALIEKWVDDYMAEVAAAGEVAN